MHYTHEYTITAFFLQPHRRFWDRWVMMGGIGVTTGLVAYWLYVVGSSDT